MNISLLSDKWSESQSPFFSFAQSTKPDRTGVDKGQVEYGCMLSVQFSLTGVLVCEFIGELGADKSFFRLHNLKKRQD